MKEVIIEIRGGAVNTVWVSDENAKVVIIDHDTFEVDEGMIEDFKQENGVPENQTIREWVKAKDYYIAI
jgi:hypothetical protein